MHRAWARPRFRSRADGVAARGQRACDIAAAAAAAAAAADSGRNAWARKRGPPCASRRPFPAKPFAPARAALRQVAWRSKPTQASCAGSRRGASCATRPTLVPSQRSSLSPRRDRARQLSPHTCTRARSKARREYSRGSRSRRRVQEPAHHSLRTSIAQQRSPTRKLRSAGSFGARGLAGRGSYPRIVASSSRRTCRTERRG